MRIKSVIKKESNGKDGCIYELYVDKDIVDGLRKLAINEVTHAVNKRDMEEAGVWIDTIREMDKALGEEKKQVKKKQNTPTNKE